LSGHARKSSVEGNGSQQNGNEANVGCSREAESKVKTSDQDIVEKRLTEEEILARMYRNTLFTDPMV